MANFKVLYGPKMSMRHPKGQEMPTRLVVAKDLQEALENSPSIPGYIAANAWIVEVEDHG